MNKGKQRLLESLTSLPLCVCLCAGSRGNIGIRNQYICVVNEARQRFSAPSLSEVMTAVSGCPRLCAVSLLGSSLLIFVNFFVIKYTKLLESECVDLNLSYLSKTFTSLNSAHNFQV